MKKILSICLILGSSFGFAQKVWSPNYPTPTSFHDFVQRAIATKKNPKRISTIFTDIVHHDVSTSGNIVLQNSSLVNPTVQNLRKILRNNENENCSTSLVFLNDNPHKLPVENIILLNGQIGQRIIVPNPEENFLFGDFLQIMNNQKERVKNTIKVKFLNQRLAEIDDLLSFLRTQERCLLTHQHNNHNNNHHQGIEKIQEEMEEIDIILAQHFLPIVSNLESIDPSSWTKTEEMKEEDDDHASLEVKVILEKDCEEQAEMLKIIFGQDHLHILSLNVIKNVKKDIFNEHDLLHLRKYLLLLKKDLLLGEGITSNLLQEDVDSFFNEARLFFTNHTRNFQKMLENLKISKRNTNEINEEIFFIKVEKVIFIDSNIQNISEDDMMRIAFRQMDLDPESDTVLRLFEIKNLKDLVQDNIKYGIKGFIFSFNFNQCCWPYIDFFNEFKTMDYFEKNTKKFNKK